MALLFFTLAACAHDSPTGLEAEDVTETNTTSPAFHVAWAKTIGGASSQIVWDVAADDGIVFLAGVWFSTLDFHDGFVYEPPDLAAHAFVAAIDGSGELLWRRGFRAGSEIHAGAGGLLSRRDCGKVAGEVHDGPSGRRGMGGTNVGGRRSGLADALANGRAAALRHAPAAEPNRAAVAERG
jgi:hypothetical protein